jgi:hypothetical protein
MQKGTILRVMVAKVSFDQMGSTSPVNYGYEFTCSSASLVMAIACMGDLLETPHDHASYIVFLTNDLLTLFFHLVDPLKC